MIVLSERAYKALRIALFLGVIFGVSVAIYFLFFRTASPLDVLPPNTTSTTPGGTFPNAGRATTPADEEPVGASLTGTPSGENALNRTNAQSSSGPRITPIIESETDFTAPAPRNRGQLRFYNPADGKFYRVNAAGELTVLSDQAFYGVSSVDWGQQSDKAILEFPDGSNVYYDFESGKQATLPKHWEDFTFSPNDNQIVAKSMGNNESNRYLVIANPDGSDPRPIQELGNNGDKVHTVWAPNNQIVAYSHTGDPIGFNREQVVLIGKNQENLPGLITEGRGFMPSWSPTGNQLLYSVYTSENGFLPEVWVSGGSSETINSNRRRVQLNTWADKCTWANEETVYCAVPEYLETGAALQRDAAYKGQDQLVRVDLSTGSKTVIGTIPNIKDARNLQATEDGASLFMQDKTTGRLFTMPLSPR